MMYLKNVIFYGQSLATKLILILGYNLLNIFLLDLNFNKSIIRLHILLIFLILANFLEN